MRNFVQRFRNAQTAIGQIKRGEWMPLWNPYSMKHLTAHRDGLELWLGNGSFFCDISGNAPFRCDGSGNTYFGLFWRHYVWFAAARKLRRSADKKVRRMIYKAPVL